MERGKVPASGQRLNRTETRKWAAVYGCVVLGEIANYGHVAPL